MSRLIACASCRRHARTSEVRCPFCKTPLPKAAPTRGNPVGKFGRAALVVATTTGVAAATDLVGCSDTPIMYADAYGMDVIPDHPADHVTYADAYGIAFDAPPEADDGSDGDAPDEAAADGGSE